MTFFSSEVTFPMNFKQALYHKAPTPTLPRCGKGGSCALCELFGFTTTPSLAAAGEGRGRGVLPISNRKKNPKS